VAACLPCYLITQGAQFADELIGRYAAGHFHAAKEKSSSLVYINRTSLGMFSSSK
jgi:hypothetical protein